MHAMSVVAADGGQLVAGVASCLHARGGRAIQAEVRTAAVGVLRGPSQLVGGEIRTRDVRAAVIAVDPGPRRALQDGHSVPVPGPRKSITATTPRAAAAKSVR
jgi:hypothetical protein